MSMAFGERRQLARRARQALSFYVYHLDPHVRALLPAQEAIQRRHGFLLQARDALNQLIQLDADVAEIEGREVPQ